MVNFDRIFISRTTILMAITLGLQWVMPPWGIMLVVNVMLYLTVILMGPVSASMIALLSPWFCFHRSLLTPDLVGRIPYAIVGNLAMVFVFHLIYHANWRRLLRLVLAIVLSAEARFLTLHVPSVTFMSVPPSFKVQLLYLLFPLGSGVIALLLAHVLRQRGIPDFQVFRKMGLRPQRTVINTRTETKNGMPPNS